MPSKVYFIKDITSENLIRIYEALNIKLKSKTAIKISTGEPGGHNFLDPKLIAPLCKRLSGTIVECNTAYEGKRNTSDAHWQTIEDHGFLDIAPCDILDEENDMAIPVKDGFHLKENYVGSHLKRYKSALVLSHFKGHPMGGFGGALKNMSIGFASSRGKQHIHVSGSGETSFQALMTAPHDEFIESVTDADESIISFFGASNLAYISVANNLSVDCDCCADPETPKMADIGIFASLDPVALDQACVDAVYESPDPGKKDLIERMESRNGVHILESAEKHGIGSREYELIEI